MKKNVIDLRWIPIHMELSNTDCIAIIALLLLRSEEPPQYELISYLLVSAMISIDIR